MMPTLYQDAVIKAISTISRGTVLDLGCGIGRKSLFFARQGFKVISVDKDRESLDKLFISSMPDMRERISTILCDIREFDFREGFILINCTDVLHFLNKEEIDTVIRRMKANTLVGGLNIMSVFTKNGELQNGFAHFFEMEELRGYYSDWEVLFYDVSLSKAYDKQPDGTNKTHEHAFIIARKPY